MCSDHSLAVVLHAAFGGDAGGTMHAVELLKRQHREIEALFKKLQGPDAARVLVELSHALIAHFEIEEELLFSALRRVDEDFVLELVEEHALARFALERVLHTERDQDTFGARTTVLCNLVKRTQRCEEDKLFPDVERVLDARQIETLGKEMSRLYGDLLADDGSWQQRRRGGLGLQFLPL